MPPASTTRLPKAALVLLVVLVSLLSACDSTVEVLNPSDRYRYSLYGVLDVAADTQVIRVDPLHTPTQPGPETGLDATVILRDVDRGTVVTLQDSLTTVDAGPVRAHNLWTTHPLRPSTKYQVAVRHGDTTLTTATTTTPASPADLVLGQGILLPCLFPRPTIGTRRSQNTFVVFAQDVERIAAATIQYPVLQQGEQDTLRTWVSSNHSGEVEKQDGQFDISVFYRRELTGIHPDPPSGAPTCPDQEHFFQSAARMVVAAGGPDWPNWRGLPLQAVARPDTLSNVDGGHGFVGGIYSDTIRVPFVSRLP